MAFPLSPVNDQTYITALGTQYTYVAADTAWKISGGTGGSTANVCDASYIPLSTGTTYVNSEFYSDSVHTALNSTDMSGLITYASTDGTANRDTQHIITKVGPAPDSTWARDSFGVRTKKDHGVILPYLATLQVVGNTPRFYPPFWGYKGVGTVWAGSSGLSMTQFVFTFRQDGPGSPNKDPDSTGVKLFNTYNANIAYHAWDTAGSMEAPGLSILADQHGGLKFKNNWSNDLRIAYSVDYIREDIGDNQEYFYYGWLYD